MEQTIICFGEALIWLCVYLFIIFFGKRFARLRDFRENMIKSFRAPLGITLICYLGYFVGTLNPEYLLNIPTAVIVFCVSSLGITLAQSINGFEPLPVTAGIAARKKPVSKVLLAVLFSMLIVALDFIIRNLGFGLCLNIFHESNETSQAIQMMPRQNKLLSFFMLLSGAGIVEEGKYRLLFLTFFWKVTKKPWLALIISSLCFGLYHLTPLNSMYQVYWQFPVAQVVGAFLSGLIFGFFYMKRGFETSVLGHTLSDWLGVLFSA